MEKTPLMLMAEFPDFNVAGFSMEAYNRRFHESNVIIKARSKHVAYAEHWGALSIKCAFNGKEFYHTGSGEMYAVEDACYLVFNEGKLYSSFIDSETEVDSFTLNFSPAFERQVIGSLLSSSLKNIDDPFHFTKPNFRFTEKLYGHNVHVSPHIQRLNELSCDIEKNENEIEESMYMTLFGLLINQHDVNEQIRSVEAVKASTKAEIYHRLTRVKDFIFSSYKRNIGLHDMAEVACLNQYYLLRQFKKLFGITPHQFLTERRLLEAQRLLRSTDKTVAEVCAECGFSDQASFSKLFKKYFKVTPSDYRA